MWSAPRAGTVTAIVCSILFIGVFAAVGSGTRANDPHAVGVAAGQAVVPIAAAAWLIGYAVQALRRRNKK